MENASDKSSLSQTVENGLAARESRSEEQFPTQAGSIDPDRCEFIKPIGSGGEGDCYLLQYQPTNKLIVGKRVYHPRRTSKNVPTEVEILHRVLPPNKRIVNLLAFNLEPGIELYFEHYAGGDLEKFMTTFTRQKVRIPEAFIWHVLYQLSDALMLLHHGYNTDCDVQTPNWRRMLHRDIKPANIFLRLPASESEKGAYPDIVLADFGLAGRYDSSEPIGTACWQPPELPRHSTKSDVWAVGAIIHSLAHNKGLPPLRSILPEENVNADTRASYLSDPKARLIGSIIPAYSLDLEEAMMAATTEDPDVRASARDLFQRAHDYIERGSIIFEALPSWVYQYAEAPWGYQSGGHPEDYSSD